MIAYWSIFRLEAIRERLKEHRKQVDSLDKHVYVSWTWTSFTLGTLTVYVEMRLWRMWARSRRSSFASMFGGHLKVQGKFYSYCTKLRHRLYYRRGILLSTAMLKAFKVFTRSFQVLDVPQRPKDVCWSCRTLPRASGTPYGRSAVYQAIALSSKRLSPANYNPYRDHALTRPTRNPIRILRELT